MAKAVADVGAGFAQGVHDVVSDWKSTADPNAPHEARDKLQFDLAGFSQSWLALHPDIPSPSDKGEKISSGEHHYKRQFTEFEKMGFVMNGASNPLKRSEDLLAGIERNTRPKQSGGGWDYLLGQPFNNAV